MRSLIKIVTTVASRPKNMTDKNYFCPRRKSYISSKYFPPTHPFDLGSQDRTRDQSPVTPVNCPIPGTPVNCCLSVVRSILPCVTRWLKGHHALRLSFRFIGSSFLIGALIVVAIDNQQAGCCREHSSCRRTTLATH